MSYPNTYEEILEISATNGIGLAAYILEYGGNYTPEVIAKITAVISEANLQAIVDQYMSFSDVYSRQATQATEDYWTRYYQELSLAMAARAAQWAIAKPLPARV